MYLLFQTVCRVVLILPKPLFFGRFSRPTILVLLLSKSCARRTKSGSSDLSGGSDHLTAPTEIVKGVRFVDQSSVLSRHWRVSHLADCHKYYISIDWSLAILHALGATIFAKSSSPVQEPSEHLQV